MRHYKVAIIGGGPAGYETAIKLNQLSINTICFEKEHLGGVCLNKGCIPTKALVKVADLYTDIKKANEFGINVQDVSFDFEKIQKRKNLVVERLRSGIEQLFQKSNISIQKAEITKIEKDSDLYKLYSGDEQCCSADYVIIATGSEPKPLPFSSVEDACNPYNKNILTSNEILNIENLPESIAIIGGGVIGCEFASIFKQLGVQVTIIEFLPEILPTEDEEIAKKLSASLKKLGIKILTNTSVTSLSENMDNIEVHLSNNSSIITEKVLVSIGRNPVCNIETKGFSLEKDKGFIKVNEYCQTNEPNVFAIGDINGKLMLAHVATKQGMVVADFLHASLNDNKKLEQHLKPIDYNAVPACIFTNPEVASCGLTEKNAKNICPEAIVTRFNYAANGKAVASGVSNGFVKTIINPLNNEIMGIHIIGYSATELIAQASIFINTKTNIQNIKNIIYAHPTISETILENCLSYKI